MAEVRFTNRKLFKMRRDKQVAAASFQVDNGAKSSLIATSSSAGDSSDKVLKAGDTMTGELIVPLVTAEELDTDVINESTLDAGVTIEGVELKDGALNIDAIGELTAAAGVTVDGVLLKDGEVTTDEINEDTAGAGVTIDGLQLKDGAVMLPDSQSIFFGDASNGIQLYSNGTYVIFGRYGTTALPIYIQPEIPIFYNYAAITYHGAASGDLQSFRGNNLTGDDWSITGSSGTLKTNLIQSFTTAFVSGFTGTGFQLGLDSEMDSLIVRGAMRVYEFIVNKIRATNGSLWVTDAAKALTDMTYSSPYYGFDVEEGTNTFMAGDIIKAQAFNGTEVYSNVLRVASVTSTRVNCVTEAGSLVPSDQRSTADMDFVRIGNVSDAGRQGAIYLTSSDSNSPYLEVLDGMDSSTIASDNRKVRIGKLDGLSFDGESIGGFGLWSDSAYLTGVINAIAGEIAAWTIAGDAISASNTGGDMVLDGGDSSLTVKNAAAITKIRISPESIPDLADLASASSKSYTGSLADAYTDVTQAFSYAGHQSETYYIEKFGTTSSYLDLVTTKRDETYNIDGLTVGLPYSTIITWDTSLDYTIPSDDMNPDPDGTTSQYELGGSYTQIITVKAYSNTGVELASQVNNISARQTDLADFTIFSKTFTPTTESIYFTIQVNTYDNLVSALELRFYEWNDPAWIPTGEVLYTNQALAVDFDMQIESLVMTGTYNQVQIGENGFSHYSTAAKHFMLNEDESYYIQSAGEWEHIDGDIKLGSLATTQASKLTINYAVDGAISSYYDMDAYALNVNSSRLGFAVGIFHDGGQGYDGIVMRLGADTPTASDNQYIQAQDGNSTLVGSILNDTEAGFRIYSASDERLKDDIRDIDDDAIAVLQSIKVKKFKWKKNKDKLKENGDAIGDSVGYIAQEVQNVLPHMVYHDEAKDTYVVAESVLIPYLHTAVIQLKEENDQLKATLADVLTRLENLEKKK